MSTRFCTSCGTAASLDTLKFCTNCGGALPVVVEAVPAVAAAAPPVSAVPFTVQSVPQASPEPTPPAQSVSEGPIIRRTRTSPFLPPPVAEENDAPIISRAWAIGQVSNPGKRQLTKQRKMAGGLPSWDPLPPGELVVKRGTRKG